MRSYARVAGFGAIYLAACRIMLAPIVNFSQLRTASYGGDARTISIEALHGNVRAPELEASPRRP